MTLLVEKLKYEGTLIDKLVSFQTIKITKEKSFSFAYHGGIKATFKIIIQNLDCYLLQARTNLDRR